MIAAIQEAHKMMNFEFSITVWFSKASNVIKMDIVKPIPAKKPTPKIPFQFISPGSFAIRNKIAAKLKIIMPKGFPTINPKAIPMLYVSENMLVTSELNTIAVLAKANRGKMKNATGLWMRCSIR